MEDLPAMIDYILKKTKNEKLFFVGHSQGTTQFWVMASERPEYNSRVILTVGLAPAAFTGNLRGPVRKLTKLTYFGVVGHVNQFKVSNNRELLPINIQSLKISIFFFLTHI